MYQSKMTPTELKIARAKTSIVLDHPFFSSVLGQMPLIENATLNPPTMATDGTSIQYHPDFVRDMPHKKLVFGLVHETLHAVLSHAHRRGSRDPKRWNIACDVIINDMLVREKIGEIDPAWINEPQLAAAGKYSAEGVYNLLPPGQDGDGAGGGAGGGAGTTNPLTGEAIPGSHDTLTDPAGTPEQQHAAEQDMKVVVAQAAHAARMCGNEPGGAMRGIIDEAMRPKVDWRDQLRRFCEQRAKVDSSFAKPKRRFISQDMYLPSLSGNTLGHIVFCDDHSGSIGVAEAAQFDAEAAKIKEDLRPSEMSRAYFHYDVYRFDTFNQEEDMTPNTTPESGGTRFSPIFSEIENRDIAPACVVVLTDLCCADFGPQPDYPVLWVSTDPAGTAPWGEVIHLDAHQ
jgi:predicted metal-dependent peptidase